MELRTDIFSGFEILLASKSPRRRQLLEMAEIPFQIIDLISVDETFPNNISASEVPMFLSQKKANAYSDILCQNQIIIAADTVVIIDNQILGKPQNAEEAIEMLTRLSGRSHVVVTGVTIMSLKKQVSFSVTTTVEFSQLKESDILYYVNTYKPFDKAGAYGIQEWIGAVGIKGISGSYYNVVGMPIHRLYDELHRFITYNY